MRTRTARRLLACTFVCASLCASIPALAAGADPMAATPEQKNQALAHFRVGKEAYAQRKYDAALKSLRASYDVVASPNVRLIISRCLRDMGKHAEAWSEYAATADGAHALAPKDAYYAKTAETAEAEQKEVAAKIAVVTVIVEHAADSTTLAIGGAPIDRDKWGKPLPFEPGSLDFVVSTDGKEIVKTQLSVAAGDTKSINLDAAPPKPPPVVAPPPPAADKPIADDDKPSFAKEAPPPAPEPSKPTNLRPYAYVAGGVAAAGFVTFAIFGALEKSTYSSLQSACNNGPCPPGHADEISTGRTQQTIANIGLGVGVAAAIAGGVLFVVSMPKSTPQKETSIVVGPSFIGVRGSL